MEKNLAKAETRMLGLAGVKKYYNALQSDKEKDDFKRHMRKYINIWQPDCPFEVSTTNRYTITTHEAATTARKPIRSGDTIKYLCGNLVAMTPEEEEHIDLNRRDFSVVLSSRKKTPSLFLGPARFANHDCNANARLVTKGSEGMTVTAERNIAVGDEITVNYGEHYFGENNCECLCATCELSVRGGWAPRNEQKRPNEETSASRANTRQVSTSPPKILKRDRSPSRVLIALKEQDDARRSPKRPRLSTELERVVTGLSTPPHSTPKSSPRSEEDVYDLPTEIELRKPESVEVQPAQRSAFISAHQGKQSMKTISPRSFYGSLAPSPGTTHGESQDEAERGPKKEVGRSYLDWFADIDARSSQQSIKSVWMKPKANAPRAEVNGVPGEHILMKDLMEKNSLSSRNVTPASLNAFSAHRDRGRFNRFAPTPSSSSSALSSIPSETEDGDDDLFAFGGSENGPKKGRPCKPYTQLAPSTKRKYARKGTHPNASRICKSSSLRHPVSDRWQPHNSARMPRVIPSVERDEACGSDETVTPISRVPGDYVRTRALLSLNHSRWVDCRTCNATWVQVNGYQTRKECPRCERHSKLYGYQWPKTENARGEIGERVMDHRIVHRYISREEEKEERKRGRGLLRAVGEDSFIEDGQVSDEIDEAGSSRGLRKTRAKASPRSRPAVTDRVGGSSERSSRRTGLGEAP